MTNKKEMTAPYVSVGADTEQSFQKCSNDIITENAENINSLEEMQRELRKMLDPSYLKTMSMTELYDTVFQSRPPLIDGLLYPGTYLFVGAPKLGKSFLMAQLAYHISTGTQLWNYTVRKGTVLYLALEDDYRRLQERLYRMFGTDGAENLLSISDVDKRSFYEKEAVNSGWSVRELKRQIESSLFERLLLSRGDANKEQVLALALHGNEIAQPADIIRDPYVFEFLGLPEDKPVMESDLERALVQQIEKFLLELGRGFMFVGTQQRVTLNNTHYYVDMVFYNKILRAYVLIELKTTKLTPEAAGQINMYLNYYAAEVNDPDDNPPIGIILCTDKDSITAEYALGGLSNNIFASRYVLYMPNKEQLIRQVKAVLEKWHEGDKD